MQTKITISIPQGEKIVDEVKKIIGRQSLSSVAIDALKLYKNKAIGIGDSWCNKIPEWNIWKQECFNMPEKDLDEAISRLEQLTRIAKRVKTFNSSVKHGIGS